MMFNVSFSVLLVIFAVATTAVSLPPGKGRSIVQHHCSGCHALRVVTGKRASKQQWSALVDQMITRGAEVEDEDIDTVVEYLAKNFGPAKDPPGGEKGPSRSRPVNVNTATASELAAALGLTTRESSSIVVYREQNGAFRHWSDLAKVPGIEIRKIETHKDRIEF
jgi:competence ComEA-like helix-hairpin-helix protein